MVASWTSSVIYAIPENKHWYRLPLNALRLKTKFAMSASHIKNWGNHHFQLQKGVMFKTSTKSDICCKPPTKWRTCQENKVPKSLLSNSRMVKQYAVNGAAYGSIVNAMLNTTWPYASQNHPPKTGICDCLMPGKSSKHIPPMVVQNGDESHGTK